MVIRDLVVIWGSKLSKLLRLPFSFCPQTLKNLILAPCVGKPDRNVTPPQNHNTFKKSSFEGPKIPTHTRPWGYTAMVFRVYDIPGMVIKGPHARVPPQAWNTAGPSGASSPWAPGVQGGGAAPAKPPLRRATSPRKKGGPF